jgi:hypothetical protein
MILIPMLLKCSHIFHPMAKFGPVANMQTNEECNLNIFRIFIGTNKPTKEVVNKELQMFKRFQVDVKDIKCPLEWWEKHESMFPNVAIFTH